MIIIILNTCIIIQGGKKMSSIRVEIWNGREIRFVEKSLGEWWAVALDVAKALNYKHAPHMLRLIDEDEKDAVRLTDTIGRTQKMVVVSETGVYEAVFNSEREEAKEFKKWVKTMIKQFRQVSGLEGFQIFRMLDKEHQRETMNRLKDNLMQPARVDFIKANTIANKAVSSMNGFPKMLKKDLMSPDMLVQRQQVLDDTVNLMALTDKFALDIKVSDTIYSKYVH